jgi:vacuolar-type H+-ATPase subunit E/Vma4/transcriptional regulator with XRE-family HTH domain
LANAAKKEMKAVAERLTQAIKACSPPMSRTQLAAKLKVSAAAISHWLNGNRPCPPATVLKIAKLVKAEPGWLLHGYQNGHPGDSGVRDPTTRSPKLSWTFRKAPADGGKDFGNAAVYATPMAIKTVVREDGQNSLDASRGDDVVLRFRLVELSSTSRRYKRVLSALGFEQLRERVRAIEDAEEYESKLGAKLSAGVEAVEEDKLILLYVDDYHTQGLRGGEFDSTKAFCALVRDNLNSRKESQSAGGVFGLGSKVNLACSRLSTVLFSSRVAGEESRGTRLVGRSELTYHELKIGSSKERFAGPGWFGTVGRQPGVVESAWLPDDASVLDDLMLRRDKLPKQVRPADSTGTSILIVGFSDPQVEAGATTQQLADSFVEAAAVNFWPAMMKGTLSVIVERYVDDSDEPLKSEVVDPKSVSGIAALCDAYEKHVADNVSPALLEAGAVARISIPFSIPSTRARARGVRHHDELEGECSLLVRLADPDDVASDPRVGQIAYARGRAMVVRYQSRNNAVGGRPFHAALLAGTLVGRSNEQVCLEQFLRIAEPPAHDKWAYGPDLGERYARGAKKSLDEFHARVTEELQRILRPPQSRSGGGPEVLRRLLQIRAPKIETARLPQVRIVRRSAKVIGGAWYVEAELSVNPTPRALIVTPRLSFRCEGSAPIPVDWSLIEMVEGGATVDGQSLALPPRTRRVSFRAWSDVSTHPAEASESSVILDALARVESQS